PTRRPSDAARPPELSPTDSRPFGLVVTQPVKSPLTPRFDRRTRAPLRSASGQLPQQRPERIECPRPVRDPPLLREIELRHRPSPLAHQEHRVVAEPARAPRSAEDGAAALSRGKPHFSAG